MCPPVPVLLKNFQLYCNHHNTVCSLFLHVHLLPEAATAFDTFTSIELQHSSIDLTPWETVDTFASEMNPQLKIWCYPFSGVNSEPVPHLYQSFYENKSLRLNPQIFETQSLH